MEGGPKTILLSRTKERIARVQTTWRVIFNFRVIAAGYKGAETGTGERGRRPGGTVLSV